MMPVWEEVDARIRSGGDFGPSWYVLLVIAGLIAAVGLLTNSQILIVGAMVVGPEYRAIAGGHRRRRLAYRGTGEHAHWRVHLRDNDPCCRGHRRLVGLRQR
jgi:hypothetical protein